MSFFISQSMDVTLEVLEDRSLLALQGPSAAEALSGLLPKVDLSKMGFMRSAQAELAGVTDCRVTRCGQVGK